MEDCGHPTTVSHTVVEPDGTTRVYLQCDDCHQAHLEGLRAAAAQAQAEWEQAQATPAEG